MNFKKINNITGWVICLIACTVFIMTTEAGGSLWDCGEFVSSCYKLQIPHPPGAPLFVLIGRVFIVLFGDDPLHAAKAVNIMSALASGFTILFLFWTITHFARKIMGVRAEDLTSTQVLAVMGAGAVGALAYTFSDSFWYSAVEGEVYAMSSFFTGLVFWAIVKWEQAATKDDGLKAAGLATNYPDRWLVFIFFMMGLSIGVHLLNLLCIPAIVMVYYYKRFKTSNWGTFWAFMIGCAITGFVQKAVIQFTIVGAGYFDIFAKNSLDLPFFSGFGLYFILIALVIWIGLRFKASNFNRNLFVGWFVLIALIFFLPLIVQSSGGGKFLYFIIAVGAGGAAGYFMKESSLRTLKLTLWCFAFMLIGYSSYITTMIRSNADPAVDMYNVDNPMSLVGYLGREQYGDFPLLYGQKFTAQPIAQEETYTKYQKGDGKYIENGKETYYTYDPAQMMVFPRVWDASNDQGHQDYYASYLGIEKMQDGTFDRDPNFIDNIKFFIGYQNYFMYFRYFMWNYSGKQNDVEGTGLANPRDGNWITGISVIDNLMYGDQSKMPDSLKNNKAHNTLFALPFILGIIGMFYQYHKNKKDFLVTLLLFFFTGFAIVLYLNQAGNQPRERDYAYTGSCYAFAVWIGLSVLYFVDMATAWSKKLQSDMLVGAGIVTAILCVMGGVSGFGLTFGLVSLLIFAMLLAVAFGVPFILKNIKDQMAIAAITCVITLLVPILMVGQEWDDHDRSKKQLARDLARDYLESCAPNAILFSFGDNDTYPLWYAQEVEHIRPDIRVINYSLMGIDWYINQLRYKVNDSQGMDVIFSPLQMEGRKRDYVRLQPSGDQVGYQNLEGMLRNWVASDDQGKMMMQGENDAINTFSTKRVSVPVDASVVKQNGTVMPTDTAIVPSVNFEITRPTLMKNDLAVLAIIAANHWKRPIYFTNPQVEGLGFDNYLRRDGMSFRLVPVTGQEVNNDWMYDKVMNKFTGGNANIPGVYFDEENRRHLNNLRQAFASLSISLSQNNRKDSARKALAKADNLIPDMNMPYGMTSRYNMQNRTSLMMIEAAYRAGDTVFAARVSGLVNKDLEQQLNYYASEGGMSRMELDQVLNQYAQKKYGAKSQQEANSAEGYLQSMTQQGKLAGMTYELSQAFVLLQTMKQMENQYKPVPTAPEMIQKIGGDSGKK